MTATQQSEVAMMMRAVLLWAFLLSISGAVDPAAVAVAGESAARESAVHDESLRGAHWSARNASARLQPMPRVLPVITIAPMRFPR